MLQFLITPSFQQVGEMQMTWHDMFFSFTAVACRGETLDPPPPQRAVVAVQKY